jgi:methionine synthase II (cobalamin-independent)
MIRATAVGSLPGEEYAEAVRVVLGELPDLPHVPELPARGAAAGMIGRTLGLVTDLDADLQPAGWRLTGSSGSPALDHRRARSLLAQDLDTVEELSQEYAGPFKTQVAGPWTLAATVERPRGDKVLADHGARRELAQALAEGVRAHVRDLTRRVPGATWIVQVDEPALAAVLEARVPTASGYGTHRHVGAREASETLGWLLTAISEEGATPWVHACAPRTPWDLVRGAGAVGLSVDLSQLSAKDHDDLAAAFESGGTVALGVLPTAEPSSAPTDAQVAESVVRWLDMVGLSPDDGDLVLTPACGLAGATPAYARTALRVLGSAAARLR